MHVGLLAKFIHKKIDQRLQQLATLDHPVRQGRAVDTEPQSLEDGALPVQGLSVIALMEPPMIGIMEPPMIGIMEPRKVAEKPISEVV